MVPVNPKVAFIHEWFDDLAGSEFVLKEMLKFFPNPDIYSLVDFNARPVDHWLSKYSIKTTWIQKLPFAKHYYKFLLPFYTHAVQQFDLSKYDIVISNSHCVAKNVLTGPDQIHICMCYSPMRYAYDLRDVYFPSNKSFFNRLSRYLRDYFLSKIRVVDTVCSNSVDHFIAISTFIQRRITKYYSRDSVVIHCPVDTDKFSIENTTYSGEYYISVCRLVRYKNVQFFAEAFSKDPTKKLKIVGSGEMLDEISTIANNCPNIEVMGYVDDAQLIDLVANSKAYLFGSIEDFGIAPIEAQAAGKPVIAYGKGGALDTIKGLDSDNPTGVFFHDLRPESILSAIDEFESNEHRITADNCIFNAHSFSISRFDNEFSSFLDSISPNILS